MLKHPGILSYQCVTRKKTSREARFPVRMLECRNLACVPWIIIQCQNNTFDARENARNLCDQSQKTGIVVKCTSCTTLNGSHGEATESDDVKGKRGSSKKVIGRIAAKTVLNQLGAPAETYGLLANAISGLRVSAKRKTRGVRKSAGAAVSRTAAFSSGMAARSMSMPRIPTSMTQGNQLSVAATRYLLAFMDPFHNKARTAYIPQTPTCRTKKVTTFARGQFSTGSLGAGFIMFSPCTANDQNCIYVTGQGFAGNTFTMPAAVANGVTGVKFTGLPYNRAQMTSVTVGTTLEARVVAISARIYYCGTVVGCGGTICSYSDPDTDNILGLGFFDLGSRDITEIRPTEIGKSYSTVAIPVRMTQTHFPAANAGAQIQLYPYSDGVAVVDPTQATSTNVGPPCVGIFVAAPTTTAITFNYEVVMHIEYNGQGCAQGDLTPSSADTVGFDHIQSLLNDSVRIAAADPVLDLPAVIKREMARRGLRMAALPDY